MAKVWVLDTETKGTGAHVVPLEQVLRREAPETKPLFVPPKRAPRPEPEPEPRPPLKFKVVDLMTEEVLLEDVGLAEAVNRLEEIRSVVDVRTYVWDQTAADWRLLTLGEQKALWELRGPSPAPSTSTR
ncbi:MAG TPA: hypothetical protein VGY97_02370 [Solirubrobacteraceae bacterium]|jgi:hypothetical protein|nr:hypothetical protein [Solirubrobacteraceae bacterium]